jgi:tRNA(Ile)-lysidine synthase
MLEPFYKKLLNTIKKYSMLDKNDRVLVGFSGGPDSIALLHALKALGIKTYSLHIHHQLRDKHADEDEKFTVQTCKDWNIPTITRKIDVKKYAKEHKMSIEESARVLRYEVLSKEASRLQCNKIALGHNANDNTETVILNLTRGTGLSGLAGIPPKRDNIIRPLIETTRQEILQYLKKYDIDYCTDLTNIELGYRRNYIRHKIIPYLYKINPNLDQTILRTSEIIRTTNNDIISMVEKAKKEVLIKSRKDRIVLDPTPISTTDNRRLKNVRQSQQTYENRCGVDIKKLLSYNFLIRREIIKTMLPRIEFDQVNAILALTDKPSNKRLELTKDLFAWREYDKLYLGRYEDKKTNDKTWKVNVGKLTKIPELNLELTAKTAKTGKITKNGNYAIFDKSAITLPLLLRFRKTGDRFIPFKGKEKKLKDVLIDDKIPLRMRDRLPLLCDKKDILWIIGSRRSNIGLINKKTRDFLEVRVKYAKTTGS